MKVMAVALAALALLFAPPGGAMPAAAEAGFHAAYFSESSFLTLSPGQTGQFSVGYTNTGDQAWVKGQSGKQASLHTAAPLDSPVDSTAGWNSGWAAPNIYAVQTNDLVAPGQIGFFVYNVKVPATQTQGPKNFYGRPAIDGVGFLEDYGYYQTVTVAGSISILSSSPASPSVNNKPLLTGIGAAASETVQIQDAGVVVGSGTADAVGAFSVAVTTGLTAGTHSLIASTPTKGQSVPFTYVVQATAGPIVVDAYATTFSVIKVVFSTAMKCSSTTTATDMTYALNYFTNVGTTGASGPRPSSVTASTDCKEATLNLATSLVTGQTYTVLVQNVQDAAGTRIDSTHNTASFNTNRSTITNAEAKQDGTLKITFTKSMSTVGGTTGSGSVLNYTYYSIDGTVISSATTISCLVSGQAGGCQTVLLTLTGGTASQLGVAGTGHTVSVSTVQDAGSGGQAILPNPSARSFTTGS